MADETQEAARLERKTGQKLFHPFSLLSSKLLTPPEWLETTVEWLMDEAQNKFLNCHSRDGKTLKCRCFEPLGNAKKAEAVGEYLYFFGTLKAFEKDRIVMDMIRYQDGVEPPTPMEPHRHYRIPFIIASDSNEDLQLGVALEAHYICISALQHLLGYGRLKLKRIKKDLGIGLIVPRRPRIGLASNRNANLEDDGVMDDLRIFFEELCEMEEQRATRLIREASGISLRDCGDTVDLPSYMTKRGLYRQFCWYRGVKVTTSSKGTPIMEKRTDPGWSDNTEPLRCISWSTFRRFWRRNYGQLRIQKPIKDICGECFKYAINNKKTINTLARKKRTKKEEISIYSNSEQSSTDEEEDDMRDVIAQTDFVEETLLSGEQEEQAIDDNNVEQEVELTPVEQSFLEVSDHIRDAVAQRKFAARMRARALQDTQNNVAWSERTVLFFFDYAQTVECPFFGFEQPGDTYYYSPLSMNIFGVADSCDEQETLYTFCYHEGQGRKGGNNVASMLDCYLRRQLNMPRMGPMQKDITWGGHLVLIADNCTGQNKNRMVLRYLVYLVETRQFKRVTLSFLVAGHTKNPCDRLFNLLKKDYRQKNIFSVDDLVNILNTSPFTHADGEPVFRDWDTYFDKYYNQPDSVLKWHMFEVDGRSSEKATTMMYRRSALQKEPQHTQEFKLPGIEDRDLLLGQLLDFPRKLAPPGIKAIKQNELWKKYRPFVPETYHHLDIYQKPRDEDLSDLKEKSKAASRKRYATEKARKTEAKKLAQRKPPPSAAV